MTRRLLFITLLCLAALTTLADEERKVRLSDDHALEMLSFGPCNVFVSKGETDANGKAPIIIRVENTCENVALLLFHSSYNEKSLKKINPQTVFSKNFPGEHVIMSCEGLNQDILIKPSKSVTLPMELSAGSESPAELKLPIYVAKNKKKDFEKLEIRRKETYTLNIEAETGPSRVYLDLESRCEELVKEIERVTFCNSSKHKVSLEEQKKPYIEKTRALNEEIEQVINDHGLKDGDAGYEKYNTLKNQLKAIQFKETCCKECCKKPKKICPNCKRPKDECTCPKPKICPKCKRPIKQCTCDKPKPCCNYKDWSCDKVYNRLHDIYVKIYNKKVTKKQVIDEATALYNHAKKHKKCSSTKIEEFYNRIKNSK